ncbi:hypothetical protein GCM10020229_03190 [Kitasatospora albolonga]
MHFTDRRDAGRRLAAALGPRPGAVVAGLPRGGVPVAAEVAAALGAALDVCVVRKLGVPWQPELAMGAVGEDGALVLDQQVLRATRVTPDQLAAVERAERAELARRAARYRGGRPPLPLAGRTVVVVDDGLATGSTARAACRTLRQRGAAHLVLAVPVAPAGWRAELAGEADELVCPYEPERFGAVGAFYADFGQTSDREVLEILARGA